MILLLNLLTFAFFVSLNVEAELLEEWLDRRGEYKIDQSEFYERTNLWHKDKYGGKEYYNEKAYKKLKKKISVYDESPCHYQSFETFMKNRTPYSGYYSLYTCDDSYCLNGGKCYCRYHNGRLLQTCDCPPQFSGRRCQGLCEPTTCGRNGRCVTFGPADCQEAECICDEGYCGDQCEPSEETTGESCATEGLCSTQGAMCIADSCRCSCDEVYSGPFLKIVTTFGSPISKCLKGCVNGLSSDFGSPLNQFINLDLEKEVNVESLEECKEACISETNFVCSSIALSLPQCFLARTRSIDNALDFVDPGIAQVDYYERLCSDVKDTYKW